MKFGFLKTNKTTG